MAVEVIEVVRRSEQGVTKPYLCRCDDNETYFVKGKGAARKSQVCEWIAGNLGNAFGLPLAPFEIVNVPEELVDMPHPLLDLSELGAGPAFGSQRCEVMEITSAAVAEIPIDLQRDVLIFDWWIRNGDRMMTEKGGNPNLFWEPGSEQLVVIDHNQAFDDEFNTDIFLNLHIFSDSQHGLFDDFVLRRDYTQRFAEALRRWPDIIANMPEEWHYLDPEMTNPANINLDGYRAVLERCQHEDFWKTS